MKKTTLSILAALCFLIVGKASYDRGYSRGQTKGRVDLATMYVDAPEKFLVEAEIWCTADMIENYKTLGIWQQSVDEAKQKLYNEAKKGCKVKIQDATVRLGGDVK